MTHLSRRATLQAAACATLAHALPLQAADSATPPVAITPTPTPTTAAHSITWRNWSGSASGRAQALQTPATVAELQGLLRGGTGPLRCVGAGHSFTPLVPTEGNIVSLDRISGLNGHDAAQQTATCWAGTRLAQLSRQLDQVGLALRNLPDIDVQSLAGAIGTGTHGTGAQLPALHADLTALQLVRPDGELLECSPSRRSDLFAAAQVSLGSLGVITQATLRVVPAYKLQRKVWLQPVEDLLLAAPKLAQTHRHFEFYYLPFTGYAAGIAHDLYHGSAVERPESGDEDMLRDLRRLRDWLERFPDLRRWVARKLIDPNQTETARDRSYLLLSTQRPTKFNETECHVPREAGIACVREVIQVLERRNEVFFPLEFRFVQADDAWLSPFHRRDSCSVAVHAAAGEPYDYLVRELGPVFRKYQGRPHWGKLHGHTARDLAGLYPRWKDFLEVRAQMDPTGRMLNPHLRSVFGLTERT